MPNEGDTKCQFNILRIYHVDSKDASKGSWKSTGRPCLKDKPVSSKVSDRAIKRAMRDEKKRGGIQSELFK